MSMEVSVQSLLPQFPQPVMTVTILIYNCKIFYNVQQKINADSLKGKGSRLTIRTPNMVDEYHTTL